MSDPKCTTCAWWVKPHRTSKCTINKANNFLKGIFILPTTSEFLEEQAKKNNKIAKDKALALKEPTTPMSPTNETAQDGSAGEFSPASITSVASADTELVSAGLIQISISTEDSLEPSMPLLPSMSTPGVYIPALHGNIGSTYSVVTEPFVANEERTVCDNTEYTQDNSVTDNVVNIESVDNQNTFQPNSAPEVVVLNPTFPANPPAPYPQQGLSDADREAMRQAFIEDMMADMERVELHLGDELGGDEVNEEVWGDDVSELGNTYFDAHTVLVNTDDYALNIDMHDENRRLQAENDLLKLRFAQYNTFNNNTSYTTETDDQSVYTKTI